jgi:hypothetical protein
MRIILVALLLIAFTSKSQSLEEKIKMRVDYKETPGIVVGIYENGKVTYYSFGVKPYLLKRCLKLGQSQKHLLPVWSRC